jgi:outer membrane protein assembly factor BamB
MTLPVRSESTEVLTKGPSIYAPRSAGDAATAPRAGSGAVPASRRRSVVVATLLLVTSVGLAPLSPSTQRRHSGAPVGVAVLRDGADPLKSPNWHIAGQGFGRPAADAQTAYFLSADHEVVAIDIESGTVRWRRPTGQTGASSMGANVVLTGDSVVVGDNNVIAFDRVTGSVSWRFASGLTDTPGLFLGDADARNIYTGSASGRLYAIDASSGREVWSASPVPEAESQIVEPVATENLVFAAYRSYTFPMTGGLVAVDASTGRVRWKQPFPRASNPALSTQSASNLLLVDRLLIAASGDGNVWAVNQSDGAVEWSVPTLSGLPAGFAINPNFDYRALARSGSTLLIGSLTGYLVAYDIDTRRELWRNSGSAMESFVVLSSDDTYAYVANLTGRLTSVKIASGAEHWRTGGGNEGFRFAVLPHRSELLAAAAMKGFYSLPR